jgi:hypothetical protein
MELISKPRVTLGAQVRNIELLNMCEAAKAIFSVYRKGTTKIKKEQENPTKNKRQASQKKKKNKKNYTRRPKKVNLR